MDGYQSPCAGSRFTFSDAFDDNMNLDTTQAAYLNWQQPQFQQLLLARYEQSPTESHSQYINQWPNANMAHQPFVHRQHLSTSSYSSTIPSVRSSNNSVFSQLPLRDSVSSSISGWSHSSELSKDQSISQAEYLLSHNSSAQPSYAPSPAEDIEEPVSLTVRRRPVRRPATQEKDYFKTCVSGSKQSRQCEKEHKYFCTICQKTFVEKADWKRHEETYQERPEKFQCDLCPAIYFLGKDFATHHSQSHRCVPCSENKRCSNKPHVLSARRKRMTRTGWGCGFCCHFSSDWTERCNHIAQHVEKEGMTAAHWYHSKVIYSLLQRPTIYLHWARVLRSRPHITTCSWNQHSTGRVEGYPESNPVPQLQDYLEYFTPEQNAAALAQLAFDKRVKTSAPQRVHKPLPVLPRDKRTTSLQELRKETESWTQLINSVIEDDVFPTGVEYLESWYPG